MFDELDEELKNWGQVDLGPARSPLTAAQLQRTNRRRTLAQGSLCLGLTALVIFGSSQLWPTKPANDALLPEEQQRLDFTNIQSSLQRTFALIDEMKTELDALTSQNSIDAHDRWLDAKRHSARDRILDEWLANNP